MFNQFYKGLTSFPEEKFVTEDKLSESVLISLRDPICLNIPNIFCKDSPAECKRCSQVICAKCVEMIVKADAKCPNCRDYLQVRKMNRYLKHILASMKMRCHLHTNGCPVALPLEELINHENQCDFESVPCPKQCGQRIIKKFIDTHIENECALEDVKCKFKECGIKVPRNQLEKHHAECSYRMLSEPAISSPSGENSKGFDNTEIILCYKSDSDALPEVEEFDEVKRKEKYWKLSVLNFNDLAGALESSLSKCRNAGCKTTTIYAELIQNHEKICCYKIEPCPNNKYGCTYIGNQYGLVSHQLKCEFAKFNEMGTSESVMNALDTEKEIEWTKNPEAKELLTEIKFTLSSVDC